MNRKHSHTKFTNSLEMSISRGVFEGDINCDCIFTGFFEAPGAGGTGGKGDGGTRVGHRQYQHFKKLNKNPLG